MSFIHFTVVGHFDPRTVSSRDHAVTRPIDPAGLDALLAEYPDEVRAQVTLQDGYARCQWAPAGCELSAKVVELAYRLARREGCLAVENWRTVEYPPEAARAQGEVWENAFGQAGFAESHERRARARAEAFDRRLRRR